MGFKRGNTHGRGNRKARVFEDMIRVATSAEIEAGKPKLRAIAEKLTEMALDGDLQAIKEIGDRLDGKAKQSIDVEVNDNNLADLTLAQLSQRIASIEEGSGVAAGEAEQPESLH